MTHDEKAIATAIAEYLAGRGDQVTTDVGLVQLHHAPYRKNPNDLRGTMRLGLSGCADGDEYDVTVTVTKRVGYIR